MVKIGVFVGSLREGSWNRKIAQEMVDLLPEGYEAEFLEISDLPLYNEDWDRDSLVPQQVERFRKALENMHGFIWASPEYNRGVPGVLKNAIDIASRPMEAQAFKHKPSIIATASSGAMGGFGANHQLRQTLVCLDSPVVAQPELYLSHIDSYFDDGNINPKTKDILAKGIAAFVDLMKRYKPAK